ncbi:MAG: transcription initiation factor IIB [Candidatus Thermoplasmatota archaeon]|nr:transcription initiation factor IIB [Candidatus Thermoplasmatota archaeon]
MSENKEVEEEEEDSSSVEKVTECPECGSRHLAQDYDRGELICEDCGLVIDNQYIDEGPEWRAFDMKQEEERARTGAPMTELIHDKGLSTSIDSSNRDSSGRAISSKKKAHVYRLRKWQRRIRVSDATERNLAHALTEMGRLASIMGLPKNIRETAAVIYRKAVKKNLIRGRSIKSVVAASLYAACRKASVPRTLDEIAEPTSSGRKDIGRTYRFLSRELTLKLKPTKPQDYLDRFCSELDLSGKVRKIARNIIDQAEEQELISGKGPTGLAAAALYIASINGGERRTQREVADVAAVTEVTIRNRYKELVDKLDIDIEV